MGSTCRTRSRACGLAAHCKRQAPHAALNNTFSEGLVCGGPRDGDSYLYLSRKSKSRSSNDGFAWWVELSKYEVLRIVYRSGQCRPPSRVFAASLQPKLMLGAPLVLEVDCSRGLRVVVVVPCEENCEWCRPLESNRVVSCLNPAIYFYFLKPRLQLYELSYSCVPTLGGVGRAWQRAGPSTRKVGHFCEGDARGVLFVLLPRKYPKNKSTGVSAQGNAGRARGAASVHCPAAIFLEVSPL